MKGSSEFPFFSWRTLNNSLTSIRISQYQMHHCSLIAMNCLLHHTFGNPALCIYWWGHACCHLYCPFVRRIPNINL